MAALSVYVVSKPAKHLLVKAVLIKMYIRRFKATITEAIWL